MKGYQQEVREAIFLVANLIEGIVREQVAREIEGYIEPDHEARAFTLSADIARGER
jgi:hypothetical protein